MYEAFPRETLDLDNDLLNALYDIPSRHSESGSCPGGSTALIIGCSWDEVHIVSQSATKRLRNPLYASIIERAERSNTLAGRAIITVKVSRWC